MESDGGAWRVAAETGWGPADMGAANFHLDPIDRFVISDYSPIVGHGTGSYEICSVI
jgi:hypothetical protein